MKHKNLDQKIRDCEYVRQCYEHILTSIKSSFNSNEADENIRTNIEKTESFAIDLAPPVDKFLKKYDEKFN